MFHSSNLFFCVFICDTLNVYQKILWIGPVKFHKSSNASVACNLAQILSQLRQSECDVTVVGNKACEALMQESSSVSDFNSVYNASVVWEFLKGRKLPGVTALDRVSFMPTDFLCHEQVLHQLPFFRASSELRELVPFYVNHHKALKLV